MAAQQYGSIGDRELKLGDDGLPDLTQEEKNKAEAGTVKLVVGLLLVADLTVPTAIAAAIYYFGDKDGYDGKIATIAASQFQWVFLAAYVLFITVVWVNMYPLIPKARVVGPAGNIRSNMYIFRDVQGKAVLMDEGDGDCGRYTRANRSLHHMTENLGPVSASLAMTGYVFPFPLFVLVCIFAVGRVWHQIGYMGGYGKHAGGFMLAATSACVMHGLLLIASVKAFGFI